jgi:SAM-dependent methyltransferase
MTLQNSVSELWRLAQSMQTLAAIGAEIRLRQDSSAGDQRVRDLLQDVMSAMDPSPLEGLNAGQEAMLLSIIRIVFRDAADLLNDPARAPGWSYSDAEMLEAQGRASRLNIASISAFAAEHPKLAEVLAKPGSLLDIGTGVGHLAIEAAKSWPKFRVVGIDIWDPALKLARTNVETSGAADRIELRKQDIEEFDDRNAFDLVWLPAPFLPRDVFAAAVKKVFAALRPGGWLVVGQYRIPQEPVSQALARLQIVRSGGYPWEPNELAALLSASGFEDVEVAPGPAGGTQVFGRRPNS